MTSSTKTSTALLVAWLVLIAGLVAAIVFFTVGGKSTTETPDVPVVPVKPKEKPKPPERHPPQRGAGRRSPGDVSVKRETVVSGVVRSGAGELVGGAHVALFAWTQMRQGPSSSVPPDMDQIKLLNQIVYITPEDWDSPRPLATWTGGEDDPSRADTAELAGADTKDDGTFSIPIPAHLGTGPFRLTAHKAGVGSATMSEVKGGGPPLAVLLGPEASVTGQVITEVDSVPVEGARVSFDSGGRRLTATTGAGGRFTVEGVTPGRYELIVGAKGKTPLVDPAYTVHPNDTAPVTFRLPRGTLLRVNAVTTDPNGTQSENPLANADIAVYAEDSGIYVMAKTNAAGVADFPGMPAGRYIVNGMAKGWSSAGEEQIVVDRNQLTTDHTVTFEPAVETPVEVVDEEGRPIAGMDFYSVNNDEKYDSLRSMKMATSDSDGKVKFPFEFDGPRSALYGFKPGYAMVHAYPDDNTTGDPLRLVAKKPVRVKGTVKTTDGRGIPDTVVAISISEPQGAGDMELELRADKDGHYDFPYLPRAEGILISATAPDGISQEDQELELVSGQSEYTIDILIEFDELVTPMAVPPKARMGDDKERGGKDGDKTDDKKDGDTK